MNSTFLSPKTTAAANKDARFLIQTHKEGNLFSIFIKNIKRREKGHTLENFGLTVNTIPQRKTESKKKNENKI